MQLIQYQEQFIACKFYDLYNCIPQIRYIVETAEVKEEEECEPASEADVEMLVKEALETNNVTEFARNGMGLNQNIDELSLPGACCIVLQEANPFKKAALSLYFAKLWFGKKLKLEPSNDDFYPIPPKTPARDVKTVDVNLVPKRGGAGNKKNVIGLVHSLAHKFCSACLPMPMMLYS